MKLSSVVCASLVVLGSAGLATPPSALAAPKAVTAPVTAMPACALTGLPLMVGNSWTYTPIAAPVPLTDAQQRTVPLQPKKVVVTVDAIDVAAGVSTVHLTETSDKRVVKSTIVCSAGKLDTSPDSLFFVGEPGGYLGLAVTEVTHAKAGDPNGASGTGWVLAAKGAFAAEEWHDDITAKWAQQPTEGTGARLQSGRIEIERRWVPYPTEAVSTAKGNFDKAQKLMVQATGRVFLDGAKPDAKPYQLAEGLVGSLWFVDGVGVVQVGNAFHQMYTLSDYKLAP